jgi:hypothetical protein
MLNLIYAIKHLIFGPCSDVECERAKCRWARLALNGVRTCPQCETCIQADEQVCPVCN